MAGHDGGETVRKISASSGSAIQHSVMAGLVPAIHVFVFQGRKTWMPGTRPGMTAER